MTKTATDTITITYPGGGEKTFPAGTLVGDALKQGEVKTATAIMAAYLDHQIKRLDTPLEQSGALRPVEHASIDGMAIYERTATCLMLKAVRQCFPSLSLYVNHSIDNCLFCELHMTLDGERRVVQPDKEDLERLTERIQEFVDADTPLETNLMDQPDAVELFRSLGVVEKAELLSAREPGPIHVYSVGDDFKAHFYGYLAPSTGVITKFALEKYHTGFLLKLPKMSDVTRLPERRDVPKLYKQYAKYETWINKLGVPHVPALNKAIESGRIHELILVVEALHEKRFSSVADKIMTRAELPRVICLAGPSSSGKTTSARRIRIQLMVNGIEMVPIGLDDYFVDREFTPRDEKGEYDFESFEAIDSKRVARDINALIAGEEIELPKYDFKTGTSKPHKKLRLKKNQVLLMEGIHGLNPKLLEGIPRGLKFRIYISPVTALNLDTTNRIKSTDVRILRRMVRDAQYRGYSAEDTLNRWASVRAGEEKHIFPFQYLADFILNSSLIYELTVLKSFALPLLETITPDMPSYSEARRLLNLLGYFHDVEANHVPTTSILREFIGGSVFNY